MVAVRHTSETGGEKGRKLEEYALIPPDPLAELARVYGVGAAKYSPNNYQNGYPYSWSLSAMQRHIEAFRSGHSRDGDTHLHHLAHAAWHAFTLIEFEINKIGTDDRLCTWRKNNESNADV